MAQFHVTAMEPYQPLTTASTGVVCGPVDVSFFKECTFQFKNSGTAALLGLKVQATHTPDDANSWTEISTATIPSPSALGSSAVAMTSAVLVCQKWMRVLAHASATASLGTVTVTMAGRGL
jgi:hypothetical protein